MIKTDSMPQVVIVSPALRDANNGNWQTARRWQQHLAATLLGRASSSTGRMPRRPSDQLMIALHARRSATPSPPGSAAHPGRGLAVVLTGTDLYRDIHSDAGRPALARRWRRRWWCCRNARRPTLPAAVRAKSRVIFQSTTARQPLPKSPQPPARRHGRPPARRKVAGHAVRRRPPAGRPDVDIHIDHIGAALDPALGAAAQATMAAAPNYRWLGGLPHEAVRRRIQRAHLLVHASRMEGGAHVVMEAVASGTPVLASHIDGNVGMLGADYAGYFPCDDAAALAALLRRCR